MSVRSLTAIANDEGFTKTFSAEYTGNASGATLITPSTNKVLKIAGVYLATNSSDGKVRVYFSDDEDDATNTVHAIYGAESNVYIPVLIRGDVNAVLKVDSTVGDGDSYVVIVNYDEE